MQPDAETLTEADEARLRASERRNFFLSTTLRIVEHGELTARVRNLSNGGMMIEIDAALDIELQPGEPLTAELRNIGRVKGEIAWAAGRRYGVRFDREIDPELARKPVTVGEGTPDYAKAVLVKDRALKGQIGLRNW